MANHIVFVLFVRTQSKVDRSSRIRENDARPLFLAYLAPDVTKVTRVIHQDPPITKVTRVIETDPTITHVTRVVSGKCFDGTRNSPICQTSQLLSEPNLELRLVVSFPGPQYSVRTGTTQLGIDG